MNVRGAGMSRACSLRRLIMAKKKKTVVGIDEDVFELLVKACGKRMMATGKFCSMTEIATKGGEHWLL